MTLYRLAYLGRGVPLAALLLCLTQGCSLTSQQSSVISPKSIVVARATGTQKPWLKSADLTYWRPRTHAGGVQPVSHSEQAGRAEFSVLGVKYPHPDRVPGKARVELVVAGPAKPSGGRSWLGGVSRVLDETLPGMSWGNGIRQAKSLDIPVSELQSMLQETRQIMLTTGTPEATPTANLVAEVNDRRTTHAIVPLATFEKLKQRVSREGRLISYHGSAEELQQRLGSTSVVLAGGTPSQALEAVSRQDSLVSLPPVR